MSKIAKTHISIPEGTSFTFENNIFSAKGKLGNISLNINDLFTLEEKDNKIIVLPKNLNLISIIGSVGAILSIFMWSLNPLSDFQCSTDKSRGFISRVVDTTNFVTTWVIAGFLV